MQIKTYLLCQWFQRAASSPTNLDITVPSTAANIVLTWTNPTPSGSTNEVWKSADGITFALFTTVAGGTATATDASGLAAGNFFYYKVRSCSGGNCSAFSSTISACNNFISPNVATISLPTLIRAFGGGDSFKASGLAALTSVSLPALKRVDNNLNLSLNPAFTVVNLNALAFVGGNLFLGANALAGSLSLPSLTATADLQFQNNNITSFSAPLLTTVVGNFIGRTCPLLTSVTVNNLTTIGAGFDMTLENTLTTLSFPALTSVGGDVLFNNSPVLTSVLFPVLTTITPNNIFVLNGQTCGVLASLSIPVLVIANGFNIAFTGDALNAASINQILARGVASGVTTCTFDLAAGTNAAPSGQGVADKATLIGAGNTVNTN